MRIPLFALPSFILAIVLLISSCEKRPILPTVSPASDRDLIIDFPASWSEIPGKLSRTYRSPRPGAGLLQLSLHPPLPPGTDAAGAARELDTLLNEMETEMKFGERLNITQFDTNAGPLAFAKYRSPGHGVLGFWLLASDQMIFATYVDGGPDAAEKDIAEALKAFQNARFE
jgi:hypothetical protein